MGILTRRLGPRRVFGFVAILLAAGAIAAACGGGSSFEDPRLQVFDDGLTTPGQDHLQGQLFPYPTTPPYGGPHSGNLLPCGIYEDEQPFESIVHTMEHGAVVLYFQPDVFTTEEVAELRVLGSAILRDGKRFVLTPNRQISQPIALASWGRLLALDRVEEQTVLDFVAAFENDGPEKLDRGRAC